MLERGCLAWRIQALFMPALAGVFVLLARNPLLSFQHAALRSRLRKDPA